MILKEDIVKLKTKLLAIHFETATSNKDSLNTVGIALYEYDDIKVNKEINIDKEDKQSFINLLNEITKLIDKETLVISQNATFDISVIRYFCDKFKMEYPSFDYLCTWKLNQILYGEDEDIEDIEIDMKNSPQKAFDTIKEYKNIIIKSPYKTLKEILDKYHISKGKLLSNDYKPFGINRVENQLHRKNIVFTGGLSAMRRAEAFKIVKNLGAFPSNTVSKTTDILVIGNQGLKRFNTRGKSSKMLSAERLVSQGMGLKIITEDEFLIMVNIKE